MYQFTTLDIQGLGKFRAIEFDKFFKLLSKADIEDFKKFGYKCVDAEELKTEDIQWYLDEWNRLLSDNYAESLGENEKAGNV